VFDNINQVKLGDFYTGSRGLRRGMT